MESDPAKPIRLGTRGSLLARMQSELVATQLRASRPGLVVETVVVKTTGDRIQDKPLHDVGGKGLFTKELEQALLAGQIDFAVHSYKDVPVTMPLVDASRLTIASVPAREDPRDVLASRAGWRTLSDLPAGARVGTGSLRRRCQILAIRPDVAVVPVRGNIDSRLRKLGTGELDAVILAAAGLHRAALFNSQTMTPIETVNMVPSPGQGALALQCRADDASTIGLLKTLDDSNTAICVGIERELVRLLRADCHSPVGVYARLAGGTAHVAASVGAKDGEPPLISVTISGSSSTGNELADRIFTMLDHRGAMIALHGA